MADKRRTIKTKNKPDELRPIPPNVGVESEYRRKMQKLIKSMQNSVTYWLESVYRNNPDMTVVSVKKIQDMLDVLKNRWFGNFDEAAPTLAAGFVAKASKNLESNMERQLAERNFGIKFELTAEMRAIVHAEIVQNVSLIQSIPSQYFTEVEGLVMRSVAVGGDLKTLSLELHKRYGITLDRAGKIAMDQNRKVNAAMKRARQLECGITKAIWIHTACRYPRQSHVDYNGKEYDVAEGALIDGKRIWPGSEINCGCLSKSIMSHQLGNR